MENNTVQNINKRQACYQVGYIPVPLLCVPPKLLVDFELYIATSNGYSLYREAKLGFTKDDYKRLLDSGVAYVYISVKQHQKFNERIEMVLLDIVRDPRIHQEKKAEILYSTSLELANQLMESPPTKKQIDQTKNIARSSVEMIMQDGNAFKHLCEISNHDYYTATHMVNVCSNAIFLAGKMGVDDKNTLQNLGMGSMLHDIGKLFVPNELLNECRKLTDEQYKVIQTHVEKGYQHLKSIGGVPEEALQVAYEHHERLDGSGYPRGLKGKEISFLGRLVAIIDTFEAMTSVRPYREKTLSVEEALAHITGASDKYDEVLSKCFSEHIKRVIFGKSEVKKSIKGFSIGKVMPGSGIDMRQHERYFFRMQIRARELRQVSNQLELGADETIIVHNISRCGAGLLCPRKKETGNNICLTLPVGNNEGLINVIAKIVRCDSHHDGWFTVGVKFIKIRDEQFISKLRQIAFLQESTRY
ncbi:MAG: HD domain-containing protein [Phycisphaerae bacterium]|nr:HD domain-containing protein [Phycisphaerae bacterium]